MEYVLAQDEESHTHTPSCARSVYPSQISPLEASLSASFSSSLDTHGISPPSAAHALAHSSYVPDDCKPGTKYVPASSFVEPQHGPASSPLLSQPKSSFPLPPS